VVLEDINHGLFEGYVLVLDLEKDLQAFELGHFLDMLGQRYKSTTDAQHELVVLLNDLFRLCADQVASTVCSQLDDWEH